MATNDIKQTHKQYNERKQRIKTSQEYNDRIEKNVNEIYDIDKEIKRLTSLKEKKLITHQKLKDEKYHKMLSLYNHSELITEIIEFTKNTTYSRTIINDVEKASKNGINVDTINSDTLEQIISMDNKILKEIPHTNIIGDLLNNFGETIKLPGENNEEDDKNGT